MITALALTSNTIAPEEDLRNALDMCQRHRDHLLAANTQLETRLRVTQRDLGETTAALTRQRQEVYVLREFIGGVIAGLRAEHFPISADVIEAEYKKIVP